MATEQTPNLAADLERFIKEQASRFGDVISYVPVPVTVGSIVLPPAADPLPVGDRKTAVVLDEGLAGLEAKLAPYKDEKWMSATSLDIMQQEIHDCQKCALGATRNKLVFGVGNQQSKVLVIGEAPGADEDEQGEPFVGRAGQLLNKMLAAVNFERSDVYIANILKSRPPNNRDPKPEEVAACEPYLWKQILLLQPKLILCLGRVAGTNMLKINESLGKMRGQIYDFHGIQLMVTYHPAALLRNPDWKHGAWEDLKKFRAMFEALG